MLKKITRSTVDIPVLPLTVVERGDTLQIAGFLGGVAAAAKVVGYALRPSPAADVVFISIAILIGGFVGALSFVAGGVPIGLGLSGGALVAGLLAGYLRGRSPTFGNVSPGAQWVFDSFALTVFVAIVGIQAGPTFVAGLKSAGLMLLAGGVLVPFVALILAALFGKFALKLNNVILCGALAGADLNRLFGRRARRRQKQSRYVRLLAHLRARQHRPNHLGHRHRHHFLPIKPHYKE